jgi:hypothetical protein
MNTNYCVLQDSYVLGYDAVSHWLVFPGVSEIVQPPYPTHKNEGNTFLPMSGNTNPETRRHMPIDKCPQ